MKDVAWEACVRGFKMALGLAGALLTLAFAVAAAPICVLANARKAPAYFAGGPLSQSSGRDGQEQAQPQDFAQKQGPFSIGDQQYTVVLHEKVLGGNGGPPPGENSFLVTLAELDIADGNGQFVFQETFPFTLAEGRFLQTINASASLLTGQGGMGLVIQFVEQTASAAGGVPGPAVRQSWQVFGLSNGALIKFGPVLPVGQGSDIAVGGVVTAVMAKGGVVVMPLATTAEEVQVRAWTGNFYVLVPVRVDWMHAQWGEAEECYELAEGTLRERGCTMPVEAPREPASGASGNSGVYVLLFASITDKEAAEVPVLVNSAIDILEALATAHWKDTAGRSECSFDNVWLRVRIDGKEGWVHGQESFDALGLPLTAPR